MPYTEADFERMKTDPVLNRQYFWRCFMEWRRDGLDSPFLDSCFEWLEGVSDADLLKLANS